MPLFSVATSAVATVSSAQQSLATPVSSLMVNPFPLAPQLTLADNDDIRDFHWLMKTSWHQIETTSWLAAFRLAGLISVKNDLDVARLTTTYSRTMVRTVRRENTRLQSRVSQLSSRLVSTRTQQKRPTDIVNIKRTVLVRSSVSMVCWRLFAIP